VGILGGGIDQDVDVFRESIEAVGGNGISADQGVLHAGFVEIAGEQLQVIPGGGARELHQRCFASIASTVQRRRSRSISSAEW